MASYDLKRLLVCGSRNWTDRRAIHTVLEGYLTIHGPYTVISGMAPGADTIAAEWAVDVLGRSYLMEFPADWGKYGKAAGPIRNQQMLDEGNPDHVWGFLHPDSRGTKHMLTISEKAGKSVYSVYGMAIK